MSNSKFTTIQITHSTLELIREHKTIPRETNNDVVVRAIKCLDDHNNDFINENDKKSLS